MTIDWGKDMSTNNMNSPSRVNTRVDREVHTPIGDVYVHYNPIAGNAEISFHTASGEIPVFEASVDDDGTPVMTVSTIAGPKSEPKPARRPAKGDEVTQDGTTFEVVDTKEEDGFFWMLGDNGRWTLWNGK